MKKLLYIFFAVAVSFALFVPSSAYAKVISMEKGVVQVSTDEVIDDDLFAAGETIQIEGTVNGDVYAGGETVIVAGTINGDLHAVAGMVQITGTVSGDAYVGAGNVNINGAEIGDSLLVGAGNVHVDDETTIGGSVLAGVGNLSLYSQVGRNVMVGAGTVDINSAVGGEARMAAGEISLGPNTQIAKDLHYSVGKEGKDANIAESATIAGQVKKYDALNDKDLAKAQNQANSAFKSLYFVSGILSFLGALIVSLLWLRFFPRSLTNSADLVKNFFWKSLGLGVIICLLALPVLIILVITGIGIPLAGILFLMFLLALYSSKIIVAQTLGNWISEKFNLKKPSAYLVITLGLLAVYLVKMIPLINVLTALVILFTGVGAFFFGFKPESARK